MAVQKGVELTKTPCGIGETITQHHHSYRTRPCSSDDLLIVALPNLQAGRIEEVAHLKMIEDEGQGANQSFLGIRTTMSHVLSQLVVQKVARLLLERFLEPDLAAAGGEWKKGWRLRF
jgi:hypothetical protein